MCHLKHEIMFLIRQSGEKRLGRILLFLSLYFKGFSKLAKATTKFIVYPPDSCNMYSRSRKTSSRSRKFVTYICAETLLNFKIFQRDGYFWEFLQRKIFSVQAALLTCCHRVYLPTLQPFWEFYFFALVRIEGRGNIVHAFALYF